MSDRIQLLRTRIAQLELKLQAVRKQALAQRQKIAQKCGHEFLALVDSDRKSLWLRMKKGNIVSETDGSLVGKVIQVRFKPLH